MASKAECQQLTAEMLRLTAIGQGVADQHKTRMGEAYDEVYAELQVLGVALWDSTGEMPDEVTPHFVSLMAFNKMDLYGISDSLYARILARVGANGERGKSNIKALIRDGYEDLNEPKDY